MVFGWKYLSSKKIPFQSIWIGTRKECLWNTIKTLEVLDLVVAHYRFDYMAACLVFIILK